MVESFLLLFAGAGAIIFAVSHTLTGVIIGRALIGFGVSACLMAAFKSYVIWFPGTILSRINGFQMAAGGVGALAVFLMVPEHEKKTEPEKITSQITGVVQIFKSPAFWRIAPLTTLSQSGYITLQGLWADPWLTDVANVPQARVATILSWSGSGLQALKNNLFSSSLW
jgi:hypothetical protein